MNQDLDDYHRLVGRLRAEGLDEAQAHTKAEEILEAQPSDEEVRTN